jgi:hypothetical protein
MHRFAPKPRRLLLTAIAAVFMTFLSDPMSVLGQSFTITAPDASNTTTFVPQRIRPGTGFTEPVVPTVAVTTPLLPDLSDAILPIARWNRPPRDPVTTTVNVGVLAYHYSGIDRVEFVANGGTPVIVTQVATNSQIKVDEYYFIIDPSNFSPRVLEIRATVYPVVGAPRVLEPLFVPVRTPANPLTRYVSVTGDDISGDGSITAPFRTLTAAVRAIRTINVTCDNAIVYFMPGSYDLSTEPVPFVTITADTDWFTLARAPSAPAGSVTITDFPDSGVRAQMLRLLNLNLGPGQVKGVYKDGQSLYLRSCIFSGLGQDVGPAGPSAGFDNVYAVGTTIQDLFNGFGSKAMYLRDCKFYDIGSDPLQGVKMIVNTIVRNVDRKSRTDFHPDVLQWHEKNTENRIVYGLIATSFISGMGIGSGEDCTNIAIVNSKIDNTGWGGTVFSFGGTVNHMVVRNSIFTGSSLWRVDKGFVPHSILLDNSDWANGTEHGLPKIYGGTIDQNEITVR